MKKVRELTRTIEELTKLQPLVMKQLQTIVDKNRLAHAYIFEGEKGTGNEMSSLFL